MLSACPVFAKVLHRSLEWEGRGFQPFYASLRQWSEPGICLGFATLQGFAACCKPKSCQEAPKMLENKEAIKTL